MSNTIEVYGVSDMTGKTVSRVVKAASAQFAQGSVSIMVLAHVRSARQVLDYIDGNGKAGTSRAVFHTILDPQVREDLRNALQAQGIPSVDLLGMPAHVMGDLLGVRPTTTPGITIDDGVEPEFVDLSEED